MTISLSNAISQIKERPLEEMGAKKYHSALAAQKETLKNSFKKFNICEKDSIDSEFRQFFRSNSLPLYEYFDAAGEILWKEHSIEEMHMDYAKYTDMIRKALATNEYIENIDPKTTSIIQELCFSKFTETILVDLEEEILQRIIKYSCKEITAKTIAQRILDGNKALEEFPRAVKELFFLYTRNACNAAGVVSDQLRGSNVPELRSIHEVEHGSKRYCVNYIRHPTPTIEKDISACIARIVGKNKTIVAPEYLGFLDALKSKNIPFLYVNHQYMDKEKGSTKAFLSADNNRAEAVQKLEESYETVFYFLSLPFDGPIIKEIEKKDLISWKESIVESLIEEKHGFRIPKKFRESSLSNQMKKETMLCLLNNLQGIYFSEQLKQTERLVLLTIFYSYVKEYFKEKYEIRLMASVCKDNKDRGGISACVDEALFNLRLGKENKEQALHDLYLRSLAPFIIKYQEIVGHRLHVLTDLLKHIANLNEDQKADIRSFRVNRQYQIINQWVPRYRK